MRKPRLNLVQTADVDQVGVHINEFKFEKTSIHCTQFLVMANMNNKNQLVRRVNIWFIPRKKTNMPRQRKMCKITRRKKKIILEIKKKRWLDFTNSMKKKKVEMIDSGSVDGEQPGMDLIESLVNRDGTPHTDREYRLTGLNTSGSASNPRGSVLYLGFLFIIKIKNY